MRLSALGGHGQRQGVGHEDDGLRADVSRTLVAQAEAITPLGDLTDFAELAG